VTKTAKKTAAPTAPATSLVLRVCRADGTSHSGFAWPLTVGAEVICPDWEDSAECGNGLHGWLYGQGDHGCVSHWQDPEAKWLVLEVISDDIRMLGGKCKFPRAVVRFVGLKSEAADFIIANEPRAASVAVIGLVREVGDQGACEGGALSTLTGGYGSTLTGGSRSTLTGGSRSTLTGGDGSTLTGGSRSTLTGGSRSTLTGGDGSTLTGGEKSELRFTRYDRDADRYRTVLAYVGEDGVKANTPYRLNDDGKVVEVTK
jgi:hypothetical protein